MQPLTLTLQLSALRFELRQLTPGLIEAGRQLRAGALELANCVVDLLQGGLDRVFLVIGLVDRAVKDRDLAGRDLRVRPGNTDVGAYGFESKRTRTWPV